MIRFTSYTSGKAVSVSPELIKAVIEDENFTYIHFGPDDDYIKVSESREEVARKVLEWKLKMAKYQASLYRGNMGAAEIYASGLHMLVGLGDADIDKIVGEFLKEEPNHDT